MESQELFKIIEPIIIDVIEKKVEDGTIYAIFEEQITRSVKSALDSATGWNSDFKKKMESKIYALMSAVADRYDSFGVYVEKLTKCINDALSNTAVGSYEDLGKAMVRIAGERPRVPERMTMQDLVKNIAERIDDSVLGYNVPSREDAVCYDGEEEALFTLNAEVEEDGENGFASVILTVYCNSTEEDKDIEKDDCLKFRIFDGRVYLMPDTQMKDIANYQSVSQYLLEVHNAGTIITNVRDADAEFELPWEDD